MLTTSEAADYLRLGERKLYELVAEGAIPCTKVTGKWLFPRDELDRWMLSGLMRPSGMMTADPPLIVGGSKMPCSNGACANPAPDSRPLLKGPKAASAASCAAKPSPLRFIFTLIMR